MCLVADLRYVVLVEYSKMIKNKGQSLVEVIFGIGVVGLVLTGVVTLVIKSISVNTESYGRDKAVKLANVVVEELIASEKNDPQSFWSLTDVSNQTMTGFEGYSYSIDFVEETGGAYCSLPRVNCAFAEIEVNWPGETTGQVNFTRFFRR